MVGAVGKIRDLDRPGAQPGSTHRRYRIDPIDVADASQILVVTNADVFSHHVRVRNGPNICVSRKFAVLTVHALSHDVKRSGGSLLAGRLIGRKIGPNESR